MFKALTNAKVSLGQIPSVYRTNRSLPSLTRDFSSVTRKKSPFHISPPPIHNPKKPNTPPPKLKIPALFDKIANDKIVINGVDIAPHLRLMNLHNPVESLTTLFTAAFGMFLGSHVGYPQAGVFFSSLVGAFVFRSGVHVAKNLYDTHNLQLNDPEKYVKISKTHPLLNGEVKRGTAKVLASVLTAGTVAAFAPVFGGNTAVLAATIIPFLAMYPIFRRRVFTKNLFTGIAMTWPMIVGFAAFQQGISTDILPMFIAQVILATVSRYNVTFFDHVFRARHKHQASNTNTKFRPPTNLLKSLLIVASFFFFILSGSCLNYSHDYIRTTLINAAVLLTFSISGSRFRLFSGTHVKMMHLASMFFFTVHAFLYTTSIHHPFSAIVPVKTEVVADHRTYPLFSYLHSPLINSLLNMVNCQDLGYYLFTKNEYNNLWKDYRIEWKHTDHVSRLDPEEIIQKSAHKENIFASKPIEWEIVSPEVSETDGVEDKEETVENAQQ